MKALFDPNSTVFQVVSKIGDLILLNLLFLLCSIPVFTAGAALAAMYRVSLNAVTDSGSGVLKAFFRGFRENFLQATAAWLGVLVIGAGVGLNFWFASAAGNLLIRVLPVALALVAVMVCGYLFPLLVRYSNRLDAHLRNAAVLSLAHLPRSLLMAALNCLPVLVLLLSPAVFIRSLIFWILAGFAVVAYANSLLLQKVFARLEATPDEQIQ